MRELPVARSMNGVAQVTSRGALALLILVVFASGGAYLLLGGRERFVTPDAGALDLAHASPSFPAPGDVLSSSSPGASLTPEQVAAALAGALADPALASFGASVLDGTTGTPLIDQGAATPLIPASTNKLTTAAAILANLDPESTLTTRVVQGSHPGEVVLIGGGDPTLSGDATPYYLGAARLDVLAREVVRALDGAPITSVVIDASAFTGDTVQQDWDSEDIDAGYIAPIEALMVDGGRLAAGGRSVEPAQAAGIAFAQALGLPASAVTRGSAPRGADRLAQVDSPPIATLVQTMLRYSDNVIAEVLIRHVALARGLDPSFAGGAQGVIATLAELGVTGTAQLVDGSGLAATNHIAPLALAQLLALAVQGTQGAAPLRSLLDGLPVGGYDGTLSERYTSPPDTSGAGVVRAKTGSLNGVSTLAGTVLTQGGQLLVFALLANGGDDTASRAALDHITAALASLP